MKKAEILADAPAVGRALDTLASAIISDHASPEDITLVGLHQYGVSVAERICGIIRKRTGVLPRMGKLDITMYRDDIGLRPTLPAIRETCMPFDVDGIEVVLVDDVLSTGRTIRAALDALTDYGRPKRIRLAVLVDRGRPEYPIRADYSGMAVDCPQDTRVSVEIGDDPAQDCIKLESWKQEKL